MSTSQTVTRYASTPGQVITATFQATPLTTPTPTVAYYSDATFTTLVSGPTAMTSVSAAVWTAPVPNLPAQTLYIRYTYRVTVGGPDLTHDLDVLVLTAPDVISGDALCTLAQVKLQLGKTSTADDTELQSYIDAVTAPIEDFCGPILPAAVTNEMHNSCGSVLVLRTDRVVSVTSLTEYQGTTANAYTQISTPASAGTYTYTRDGVVVRRIGSGGYETPFTGAVYVSYTEGMGAVPAAVNLAARTIIQRWWETQRGNALSRSEDVPLSEFTMFASRIVPEMLGLYERVGGLA